MEITDVTSNVSKAQSASKGLAEDFDTFLTLLTAQLQNQDPLSPMETNEFMNQLVQFTGVEQSIQTNDNLENLISLTQDRATASAVAYIGKDVVLDSDTAGLKNGTAEWTYSLGGDAQTTSLSVVDAAGKIVHQSLGQTFIGKHTFSWDGKDQFGQQLPEGEYTLVVNAVNSADAEIPNTISIKGRVVGVANDGTEPTVSVAGRFYKLSDIVSIEEAANQQSGS